jgi:hypothetical protein
LFHAIVGDEAWDTSIVPGGGGFAATPVKGTVQTPITAGQYTLVARSTLPNVCCLEALARELLSRHRYPIRHHPARTLCGNWL